MTLKIAISAPLHNFVGLYLRNWGIYRQLEKNLLSVNTSSTCPRNIVNLRLTNGGDRFRSLGHPCKFQQVLLLGSVTAWHSSSEHQPNCRIEQRAPPIFDRTAITLGNGPHSNFHLFCHFSYSYSKLKERCTSVFNLSPAEAVVHQQSSSKCMQHCTEVSLQLAN